MYIKLFIIVDEKKIIISNNNSLILQKDDLILNIKKAESGDNESLSFELLPHNFKEGDHQNLSMLKSYYKYLKYKNKFLKLKNNLN